jgi:hypothetical protein
MTFRARRHLTTMAVLAALLATLGGCSRITGVQREAVYVTASGVAIVDTYTAVATVTAVDAAKRKVTMKSADGKSNTYRAEPEVDLSRFQVGEQLAVQVMDETALSIKAGGAPARDAVATALTAAAEGYGATVFEGEAVEVSAKITAIDPKTRNVTLQLASGTSKTIKAHGSVELSGLTVGDTVIVNYAVAMVIAMVNP